MQYQIRKAIIEDIPELISLCKEHAKFEKSKYETINPESKLRQMIFSKFPKLHCLIVEFDSNIIGYASYSFECSTWNCCYYTYLDCLFINEKFRGIGIGEACIHKIIEVSKKEGIEYIEWQTPVFNKRAIKFYKRIGAKSKAKIRFTLSI